jgi:hypothetical protein
MITGVEASAGIACARLSVTGFGKMQLLCTHFVQADAKLRRLEHTAAGAQPEVDFAQAVGS